MSDHYAQTKILNCLLYESVFEFKKIFYEKLQKGLSIVYSSDQSTKEPSLDKLNKCCDARHIERNKCMYQLSDLACTFIDLDIYIYIYIYRRISEIIFTRSTYSSSLQGGRPAIYISLPNIFREKFCVISVDLELNFRHPKTSTSEYGTILSQVQIKMILETCLYIMMFLGLNNQINNIQSKLKMIRSSGNVWKSFENK